MIRRTGFDAEADAGPGQMVKTLYGWGCTAFVTDSYSIESDYWNIVRELGALLIAIDDLADRSLPVDMIVNGLAHASKLSYQASPHTRFLLGPAYILLRQEFGHQPSRVIRERLERVLVTVGGSDPSGLTGRITEWLCKELADVTVDTVIGPFFDTAQSVERCATQWPGRVHIHRDPQDIRALMLGADLAISGGGQTTYELAACGTPVIALCLADNQRESLEAMAREGTLLVAGEASVSDVGQTLRRSLEAALSRHCRMEMSARGRALVDGRGAERLSRAIVEAHAAQKGNGRRHAAPQGRP
jgi:spore coat polysaccharide biosynthesis predicted glycosyltransferase SpsG